MTHGPEGLVRYRSANPFELYHVLTSLEQAPPQELFGWLVFPEHGGERVPAIVCCHGSLGWRGHHHEYMLRYLEMGMAVFRVHSFDARSVISVVENQMDVTMAMMLVDAYRALELLATHPRIDPQRIGITGWSLGGSVALYAAWEPAREHLTSSAARFAAHLALYPGATLRAEDNRWTSSPILNLIGDADDYTPARFAVELADELRPLGVDIETRIYAGAHHSFDSIEPLTFLPTALPVGKRTVTVRRDGHLFVTGTDYPFDEPEHRQRSFAAMKRRGAHIGGSWEHRRQAFADAAGFFGGHLLGQR